MARAASVARSKFAAARREFAHSFGSCSFEEPVRRPARSGIAAMTDRTHDPALRSWVESANQPDCGFSHSEPAVRHVPRDGRRSRASGRGDRRSGAGCDGGVRVRIDEGVMAHAAGASASSCGGASADFWRRGSRAAEALLTPMAEAETAAALRDRRLHRFLRVHPPRHQRGQHVPARQSAAAELQVAAGGVPRAGVVDCGERDAGAPAVRADRGAAGGAAGVCAPTPALDYELEVGAFLGPGNALGEPIPIGGGGRAHLFGVCLLNDWSARDHPDLGIPAAGAVSGQELRHFDFAVGGDHGGAGAVPLRAGAAAGRRPAAAAASGAPAAEAPYDITLEVWLRSARMAEPVRLSRGNFAAIYWTLAQMVAHHASNGCPSAAGRPDRQRHGFGAGEGESRLPAGADLARRGAAGAAEGETRRFLEDGDEVILRGWCEGGGFRRIGLGECRGKIVAA